MEVVAELTARKVDRGERLPQGSGMQAKVDTSLPPALDALKPLLASSDIDRVAGLCLSLLFEIVELSERVARLEGADASAANERITRLVERAVGRQ
jgi:hypothetical protein